MSENTTISNTRFVEFIIDLLDEKNRNNGKRKPGSSAASAALKRAENPKTEPQSWEYLMRAERVGVHIKIDKNDECLPYTTIASAMAKAKVEQNGTVRIGQAIARCYEDGKESDQAKAKLRRLLACETIEEVCRVLRPLFSLINSKGSISLDYISLLNDLRYYNQHVKSRWAQDFYRHYELEGNA